MILGRRRKSGKGREEASPAEPPGPQFGSPTGESAEQLLDLLAGLLRTWGEFAIELESMDEATVANSTRVVPSAAMVCRVRSIPVSYASSESSKVRVSGS